MKTITPELLSKFYNKLVNIFAKKDEVLTGGSQTTTSSTDGGVNVYTFSDGSTISVKNGSKGSTGATGATGPAGTTPTIKAAAGSSIGSVGTPSVTATTSGTTTTFTFNNLKGATGATGPKGATGATGPAGPTNLANNLTTTGTGYALDARQGKALNDSITSLKKSVSDGKSAIASAITNAGVSTASDASFAIMVENIGNIFYKRLGKQLSKFYYAHILATSGSNGAQNIYRNNGTTTNGNWIGHETFFGGALTDLNGCIIITWLKGINAITIMRHKSAWLGTDNFETLYDLNLRYSHPDGGTITLHSSAITPGVEICTLCLACHS